MHCRTLELEGILEMTCFNMPFCTFILLVEKIRPKRASVLVMVHSDSELVSGVKAS